MNAGARPMSLAVLGLLCLLATDVAARTAFALDGALVPPIWPASGVLLGALLLAPRQRWLAAAAVAWVAMALPLTVHGWTPVGAAGLAAVHVAEALAAAGLVARLAHGPLDLSRPAHLFALEGAALAVPLAGGLAIALAGMPQGEAPWLGVWAASWLAGALGLVFTAALVICWRAWQATPATHGVSRVALAATVAGAAIMAQGIYGNLVPDVVRAPTYLLPVILWAVVRLGPGGTAATMLTIILVGLWNTGRGTGPFALDGLSPVATLLRTQGAALFTGASLVLLAGMVAERRRIGAELERAVAEIRTLRGLIPICAWCHKVRDDDGFWHGIEAYLGSHTEATFSHSICPACAEGQHHDVATLRRERHARAELHKDAAT